MLGTGDTTLFAGDYVVSLAKFKDSSWTLCHVTGYGSISVSGYSQLESALIALEQACDEAYRERELALKEAIARAGEQEDRTPCPTSTK